MVAYSGSMQRVPMYKHILIATDGSPLSAEAIGKAMALAKQLAAKATVLMVTEPFRVYSSDPGQIAAMKGEFERQSGEEARRHLAAAQQQATALGVACETLTFQHRRPYEAIIETAAAKGCDLIAMASHGRSGVSAVVLGSETLKVLTHSKTPVLVYR